MTDRDAFLAGVLGTPYDAVERHCWWLARLAQRELFGRDLPFVDPAPLRSSRARARLFATHPERASWVEIEHPIDGALAMLGRNRIDDVHCGLYLDRRAGGYILHTDEPHGAVLDLPLELAQSRRWRIAYFAPA